jgi:hypothetical protein
MQRERWPLAQAAFAVPPLTNKSFPLRRRPALKHHLMLSFAFDVAKKDADYCDEVEAK